MPEVRVEQFCSGSARRRGAISLRIAISALVPPGAMFIPAAAIPAEADRRLAERPRPPPARLADRGSAAPREVPLCRAETPSQDRAGSCADRFCFRARQHLVQMTRD